MPEAKTKDKIRELRKAAILERKAAVYLRAVNRIEDQEMALKLEMLSSEKLELADVLKAQFRLDLVSVYQVKMEKTVRKGESKTYTYWYASWRVDKKVRSFYIGSVNVMSRKDALIKARKMKGRSLDIDS